MIFATVSNYMNFALYHISSSSLSLTIPSPRQIHVMFHLLCREMRKGKNTQCLGFTWCYRGAAPSQKTSINPAKFHLHHHFSPKAGTRHVSSPNFWRNARRVWAPDPSAAVDQHILTIQQCYTVTLLQWSIVTIRCKRRTVVSVTVMGSWELGLSRSPPQANGPIRQLEEEIR